MTRRPRLRVPSIVRPIVRSPTGIVGVALCTILVVIGLLGYRIWGHEAAVINPVDSLQGPSRVHLLGTDQLGRDTFARVLAAAGLSLKLALLATGLAAILGIPFGALTGVLGYRSRRLVARVISLSLTFPGILVALALVAIIGPGQEGVVIAIGVAFAPHFARTAQTLAASVADSDYMAAARVVGIRRSRILRRYVLANTADALVLQGSNILGGALVAVATFSFLGLGMQPPQFDWGRMLGEGLQSIYVAPAAALAPGAAILLAALSVSMLGEAVASALDPAARAAAGAPRSKKAASPIPEPVEPASHSHSSVAPETAAADAVVRVRDLRVRFPRGRGVFDAVAGVDLTVAPGEIVGVVGESGSGKSTLALAIAGLVPYPGEVTAKRLEFTGFDLAAGPKRARSTLLGRKLAVIFQDPMSSLNPALRVGDQIAEKARVHLKASRREATELATQGLAETHIPGASVRARQYPHEFSGGMRQRAMIAMGLITSPTLIVADEPTTALDVTVQAQILGLLRELNREKGTAILFISHDIAVVTELCSRLIVMYAGRVVEEVDVADIPNGAVHPYTKALMATVIDLDQDPSEPLATIAGRPPALDAPVVGCPFAPRCALVEERCRTEEPRLERSANGSAACWVAHRTRLDQPRAKNASKAT